MSANRYSFFDASKLFYELADEEIVSGPWYFCKVTALASWYSGDFRTLSALGFKIAKWLLENKKKTSKISYSDAKGNFVIFDDKKLASQFILWYDKHVCMPCLTKNFL